MSNNVCANHILLVRLRCKGLCWLKLSRFQYNCELFIHFLKKCSICINVSESHYVVLGHTFFVFSSIVYNLLLTRHDENNDDGDGDGESRGPLMRSTRFNLSSLEKHFKASAALRRREQCVIHSAPHVFGKMTFWFPKINTKVGRMSRAWFRSWWRGRGKGLRRKGTNRTSDVFLWQFLGKRKSRQGPAKSSLATSQYGILGQPCILTRPEEELVYTQGSVVVEVD